VEALPNVVVLERQCKFCGLYGVVVRRIFIGGFFSWVTVRDLHQSVYLDTFQAHPSLLFYPRGTHNDWGDGLTRSSIASLILPCFHCKCSELVVSFAIGLP